MPRRASTLYSVFRSERTEDEDEFQEASRLVEEEQRCSIISAVVFGLALELYQCAVGTLAFHTVWLCVFFGIFAVIRLCVSVRYLCSERIWKDFWAVGSLILCILPFMFYTVIMDYAVVTTCNEALDYDSMRGFGLENTPNVTEYKIDCGESVEFLISRSTPSEYLPVSLQFVVPFLFASLILSSAYLFGANISRSKTLFQLAMIDFIDIGTFASLPFTPKGFAWLHHHDDTYLYIFLGLVIVSSIASIAEVVIGLMGALVLRVMQEFGTNNKAMRRIPPCFLDHERIFYLLGFVCIDLPFLATRVFCVWCRIEVEPFMLFKNVLCAVYAIAFFLDFTWLMSALRSLIAMVPGADQVDSADQSVNDKVLQRRLDKAVDELKRAEIRKLPANREAGKAAAESPYANPANIRDLHTKLDNAVYLMSLIDIVVVSETMLEYGDVYSKVSAAFRSFDDDGSGKLSAQEINDRAFAFLGEKAQDAALDFFTFLQKENVSAAWSASHQIDIDTVVEKFMAWRIEEGAPDMSEPSEDSDEESNS